MIGSATAAVAAVAGGGREAGELVLEGLLIAENGHLVGQDGMHVNAEGLHILGNEDTMLLGLVLEGIKAVSEGEHRVL